MRETILLIALLVAAPSAMAQDDEPTVNDSDYDTSVPQDDQTYLEDAEAESNGEPTLSDADFDTSLPADDQSYLDDEVPASGSGAGAGSGSGSGSETPFVGVFALAGIVAIAAILVRRRS